VVAKKGIARRRHQCGKAREKLERRHDAVLGAPTAQLLDAVCDAATREAVQSLDGQRWTGAVTQ
jgi:hypothetical protein